MEGDFEKDDSHLIKEELLFKPEEIEKVDAGIAGLVISNFQINKKDNNFYHYWDSKIGVTLYYRRLFFISFGYRCKLFCFIFLPLKISRDFFHPNMEYEADILTGRS